ncbi:MAG: hypothetical protein GF398_04170 [Chitinivibrionales bacterium]|nr:hypothetical protein [Chitinivibrionales bacterium]
MKTLKACMFALLMLAFALLLACGQDEQAGGDKPGITDTFHVEIWRADSLVLAWDPPDQESELVDHYQLFYRADADSGWALLNDSIAATTEPEATVYYSDIDTARKMFLFAVRSVAASGIKSDFHFSSDSSEYASGGWRLRWER